MAFAEVRGLIALGFEGEEEAHTDLRNFEVSGVMKGSPDMGEVSEAVVDSAHEGLTA